MIMASTTITYLDQSELELVMFSPIRAEHYLVLISAAQALSSPDSHELEVISEKPYAEL